MLRSVKGIYDGQRLELDEKIKVKKRLNVLVTFLDEDTSMPHNKVILRRLLERQPVKIAPLKVKELIEEGRR